MGLFILTLQIADEGLRLWFKELQGKTVLAVDLVDHHIEDRSFNYEALCTLQHIILPELESSPPIRPWLLNLVDQKYAYYDQQRRQLAKMANSAIERLKAANPELTVEESKCFG